MWAMRGFETLCIGWRVWVCVCGGGAMRGFGSLSIGWCVCVCVCVFMWAMHGFGSQYIGWCVGWGYTWIRKSKYWLMCMCVCVCTCVCLCGLCVDSEVSILVDVWGGAIRGFGSLSIGWCVCVCVCVYVCVFMWAMRGFGSLCIGWCVYVCVCACVCVCVCKRMPLPNYSTADRGTSGGAMVSKLDL